MPYLNTPQPGWMPVVGSDTPEALAHKSMVAAFVEVRDYVDGGRSILGALRFAVEHDHWAMLEGIRKHGAQYVRQRGRAGEATALESALAAVDAIRAKAASDCLAAIDKLTTK